MFSYAEYRNIITLVKQNLPIMDFSEVVAETNSFCVLRHDIEFSIDRALEMARIEHEDLNVHSTYTVQLRNNTYNALSQKNIEAIQEIESMGHYIGLHQNPPMMENDELVGYILKDIETLEHYYGFEVDRFAFHRCGSNPGILEKYVEVPNKINCYAKEFFHYFSGDKPEELRVHYLEIMERNSFQKEFKHYVYLNALWSETQIRILQRVMRQGRSATQAKPGHK